MTGIYCIVHFLFCNISQACICPLIHFLSQYFFLYFRVCPTHLSYSASIVIFLFQSFFTLCFSFSPLRLIKGINGQRQSLWEEREEKRVSVGSPKSREKGETTDFHTVVSSSAHKLKGQTTAETVVSHVVLPTAILKVKKKSLLKSSEYWKNLGLLRTIIMELSAFNRHFNAGSNDTEWCIHLAINTEKKIALRLTQWGWGVEKALLSTKHVIQVDDLWMCVRFLV